MFPLLSCWKCTFLLEIHKVSILMSAVAVFCQFCVTSGSQAVLHAQTFVLLHFFPANFLFPSNGSCCTKAQKLFLIFAKTTNVHLAVRSLVKTLKKQKKLTYMVAIIIDSALNGLNRSLTAGVKLLRALTEMTCS